MNNDDDFIRKFGPLPAGAMSKEDEEAIAGERAPKDRGGRFPKFYRVEVEEIRESLEKHSLLAERYGVSVETIKRVREVGRFAGITYIPRDEMDRRTPLPNGKPRPTSNSEGTGYKRGRPFKSGRSHVTPQERRMMASDIRPIAEAAQAYGVSVPYLKKLRKEMGVSHIRAEALSHRMIRNITRDERPIADVARDMNLPTQIVRAIKEGSFTQNLKRGDT